MDFSSNPTISSLTSFADITQSQAKASLLEKGLSKRHIDSPDAARQAAEDLEAVFLTSLLENMFAGIKTDGPFGGGHGESVYRSMLNEQYAKTISRNGGVGIADNVYREILKLQEAQSSSLEKE